METKTIKFNINNFIADYAYAVDTKDYEEEEYQIRKLKNVCNESSTCTRKGILEYISKHKIAMQYPDLKELAGKI